MQCAESFTTFTTLTVVRSLNLGLAASGVTHIILLDNLVKIGHIVFLFIYWRFLWFFLRFFIFLLLLLVLGYIWRCCGWPLHLRKWSLLLLRLRLRLSSLLGYRVLLQHRGYWNYFLLFLWLSVKRVDKHRVAADNIANPSCNPCWSKCAKVGVDGEKSVDELICYHFNTCCLWSLHNLSVLQKDGVDLRL